LRRGAAIAIMSTIGIAADQPCFCWVVADCVIVGVGLPVGDSPADLKAGDVATLSYVMGGRRPRDRWQHAFPIWHDGGATSMASGNFH